MRLQAARVGKRRERRAVKPDMQHPAAGARLLDDTSVVDHLRSRGLVGEGEAVRVRSLGGGVSNVVLAVDTESARFVVKQALPRLRVDAEWFADPARTATEGRALRIAAAIVPGSVPGVVDLDESRNVLVIEAAPDGVVDWKQRLLAEHLGSDTVASVARRVGAMVGRLHARTAADAALLQGFEGWDAFEELRVRPYFRWMAERVPSLRSAVLPHVEAMAQRRGCLIHGDVSPKNLLVGEDLLWLIDFEVACCGDPGFDVAFMLCHLGLKAVHRPTYAPALHAGQIAFLDAYRAEAASLLDDEAHLVGLLGCLLLARVDGQSPVEYLGESAREWVRSLGCELAITTPPLDVALRLLTEVRR